MWHYNVYKQRDSVSDTVSSGVLKGTQVGEVSTGGDLRMSPANEKYMRMIRFSASTPIGVLVTAVVMAVLVFAVNFFSVPNPNMILITGLVVCAAIFGAKGGVVAAVIMLGYTLFFFSTGNDFVTFSDQNIQKVVVSLIGIVVTSFFVSMLHHVTTTTVRQLDQMNETLEEDNRLLEKASTIDTLTGTRNRFALRQDFPMYLGKDLNVMMLDIDNFKNLNDTLGHNVGDLVLHRIGKELLSLCKVEHVYRFGGDEFLIICPGSCGIAFEDRVAELQRRVSEIEVEGLGTPVSISAGYVHGRAEIQGDLRLMIRHADCNLYKSKDAGKNRATGSEFSRAEAERFELRHEGTDRRPF